MKNTFKTTSGYIPPERQADYKPRKLTPPTFEVDLKKSHNPNIAYSQTVVLCEKGRFV